MRTHEIRERYIRFFKERGHHVVASDSLLPHNDPTLLFTGAGMNQFKEYFLGLKKDFTRATSSQKCLRTGDLDNVGKTAYHHSFFEMLGNFSFGDYFKREAIMWAWEFMTKELRIPQERLRVSVHKTDEEAYAIWKNEVGLSESIIHRFGDKDNFWPSNAPQDGPNGPCGPCSEIFYDQGASTGCGSPECSPACSCSRFAEVWNLVFTQYERQEGGKLVPLPSRNIDTGMGLERIACVMQGKSTNFEIDLFQPLLMVLDRTIGNVTPAMTSSRYAIVDHVRAAAFSITDGAYPSNEGRGYVIRKLIRRAVWHAHIMGIRKPFLETILPALADVYKDVYPSLREHAAGVSAIIRSEEERFLTTLDEGLSLLNTLLAENKRKGIHVVPGESVFRLYDTYGFPEELTRMRAEEEGMQIDQEGFERFMEEQREKAKKATTLADSIFTSTQLDQFLSQQPSTLFVGYKENECETAVRGLFLDHEVSSLSVGMRGVVVLAETPFYAESGGQVGDTGILESTGMRARVMATQKKDAVSYHEVLVEEGTIEKGMKVRACVDHARRRAIMQNHTATHLLQAALRTVLGPQVRQLGSLVSEEKLRFDFSHPKALTDAEKSRIETIVNEAIHAQIPVSVEVTTVDKAKEKGALAFFGDRYGDQVRLVTAGSMSMELCGGTHCASTHDIELFRIMTESSSASGIRRIEAVTGAQARAFEEHQVRLKEEQKRAQEAKKKLEEERKQYIASLQKEEAITEVIRQAMQLGDYALLQVAYEGVDQGGLREIFDALKQKVRKTVVVLFSKNNEAFSVVVALTKDLDSSPFAADQITRELNAQCEGSGGGKKMMSFAGSKRVDLYDTVYRLVPQIVRKQAGLV